MIAKVVLSGLLTCLKAYYVRGELGIKVHAEIAYRIGRRSRALWLWSYRLCAVPMGPEAFDVMRHQASGAGGDI